MASSEKKEETSDFDDGFDDLDDMLPSNDKGNAAKKAGSMFSEDSQKEK
jgi:hypothetical protein